MKSRRKFIRNSGLALLGAGLFQGRDLNAGVSDDPDEAPRIRAYRRLGRTEAMVSDIGSGEPYNRSVLRAVLESGVNFIETSESYGNGKGHCIKNLCQYETGRPGE